SCSGLHSCSQLIVKRVKKQKQHKKALKFYKTCFGFREPFKILCDGTLVCTLVVKDIPLKTALENSLGARVELFTTRCLLAELEFVLLSKTLEAESLLPISKALEAAKSLCTVARCGHKTWKRAEDCITEVIGQKNSQNFVVATEDGHLRGRLRKIPRVPLISAVGEKLFLGEPSRSQYQFAESSEAERLRMAYQEYIMKNRRLSDDKQGNSSVASEEKTHDVSQAQIIKKNVKRNGSDVKDKVCFKRKKAKGPNPLSVLKKKKKPVVTNDKKLNNGEGSVKRKRRRKRRKTSQKEDETQDGDLRGSLRVIPCVPLISALEEESFVEDPSPSQSQFAKSSEEERLPITDLEDQITNINVERKDKVRKRKKAKGPNPLSVLKKKKKPVVT
ncbi:hypothetical protein EJD97_010650, partial [Solanum chilense]